MLVYDDWSRSIDVYQNLSHREIWDIRRKWNADALHCLSKKKSYNIFAILDPWWSSNILFISHGIYSIWSHSNAFVMSVEKRLVLGLSEKIFHVSTFISSFTIFIAELSCCFLHDSEWHHQWREIFDKEGEEKGGGKMDPDVIWEVWTYGNLRQFEIQWIQQSNVTLYMKMFIIKESVQKNAKFICIKAPVFVMYRLPHFWFSCIKYVYLQIKDRGKCRWLKWQRKHWFGEYIYISLSIGSGNVL